MNGLPRAGAKGFRVVFDVAFTLQEEGMTVPVKRQCKENDMHCEIGWQHGFIRPKRIDPCFFVT